MEQLKLPLMQRMTDYGERSLAPEAKVYVFIISDPLIDVDIYRLNQRTRQLFTHPLFEVKEVEDMSAALRLSFEGYCLIVRNSTISTLSSQDMARHISSLFAKTFDICYLAYWGDKCQLYTEREVMQRTLGSEGYTLVRTQGAQGLQCILLSPRGREKLAHQTQLGYESYITQLIGRNILHALCFSPPLAYFDLEYATSNEDFAKRNQCLAIEEKKNIPREINVNNTNTSVYWLVGLLAAIIVVTLVIRSPGTF